MTMSSPMTSMMIGAVEDQFYDTTPTPVETLQYIVNNMVQVSASVFMVSAVTALGQMIVSAAAGGALGALMAGYIPVLTREQIKYNRTLSDIFDDIRREEEGLKRSGYQEVQYHELLMILKAPYTNFLKPRLPVEHTIEELDGAIVYVTRKVQYFRPAQKYVTELLGVRKAILDNRIDRARAAMKGVVALIAQGAHSASVEYSRHMKGLDELDKQRRYKILMLMGSLEQAKKKYLIDEERRISKALGRAQEEEQRKVSYLQPSDVMSDEQRKQMLARAYQEERLKGVERVMRERP